MKLIDYSLLLGIELVSQNKDRRITVNIQDMDN
jgi:hypothetical protein